MTSVKRVAPVLLACVVLSVASARGAEPADERMEACSKQLESIGKALAAYEKDHGKSPDQLSDLFPRYLSDKGIFHCPADPSPEGTPGRDFAHRDPKMPMSYAYEFSADVSNGLPTPLGPFPKPDVGDAWGTCRHVMTKQADFFGDQVPIVRCFHHKDEYSDEERIINLTRSGRTYRSAGSWEDHPDSLAQVLERATKALAAPEQFRKDWYLGRLNEYLGGKPFEPRYAPLKQAFIAFAERIHAAAPRLGDDGPSRLAIGIAARCFGGAGQTDKALSCMDEAMDLALKAGDYKPGRDRYGSVPSEGDLYSLAQIYRAAGRRGHETAILLALNGARPGVGTYLNAVADAHEAVGQKQVAEKWHDEADPGRMLVSKPAPHFELPTPDGGRVSLSELKNGKKAVVVNFWFYGCGPCRAETPHLQKMYSDLKDKGLEMVAIDLGDRKQDVEKYVHDFGVTFKVAMGGSPREGQPSVFADYGVSAYPTNFLIDPNGKIVWHAKGYDEAYIQELRKELAKLGVK